VLCVTFFATLFVILRENGCNCCFETSEIDNDNQDDHVVPCTTRLKPAPVGFVLVTQRKYIAVVHTPQWTIRRSLKLRRITVRRLTSPYCASQCRVRCGNRLCGVISAAFVIVVQRTSQTYVTLRAWRHWCSCRCRSRTEGDALGKKQPICLLFQYVCFLLAQFPKKTYEIYVESLQQWNTCNNFVMVTAT